MGTTTEIGGHSESFLSTKRSDAWWLEPALTGAGFLAFVLYSTWAAFQGTYYYFDPYLSPFYSPVLFVDSTAAGAAPLAHSWFGEWPSWWPSFIPASPALLILAGPLSFRMTCYYYRKFYYRSYFASPTACAVRALPQGNYAGETRLFSFQNIHRYTLYLALIFIVILFYDAFLAFFKDGKFGVGVGSVILLINPILIAGYTFGCHAFRHLVGGRGDCFTCPAGREHLQYKVWKKVSLLNSRHMLWAWMSLVWVAVTDIYVRLVAMGVIHDLNTWE